MQLRYPKCTIGDIDLLVKIAKDTFVAAFEKDNEPENFNTYVETALSKAKLLEELRQSQTEFYFIHVDDVLAGYFKINEYEAQSDAQDIDSLELERIYVLEKFQGQQIGSSTLKRIIELAQQRKKRYLWLGVWEHNPKAIQFYQRHGFKKFGEHPYYIGNDKQTDWLMRYDL